MTIYSSKEKLALNKAHKEIILLCIVTVFYKQSWIQTITSDHVGHKNVFGPMKSIILPNVLLVGVSE